MIKINQKILSLVFIFFSLVLLIFGLREAKAATLTTGSLALTDSRPSTAGVGYSGTFSNVTTSSIKCILFNLSALASGSTAPPTGVGTTGATLAGTSNYVPNISSWTLDNALNGTLRLTFAGGTAPTSASTRKVNFDGIYNGSTADTQYFLRFSTYNNTDCTSSAVDSGTASFIWTTGQSVSLTVDPTISFSLALVGVGQTVNSKAITVATTTSTIPFSTVTSSANAVAAHDATVTTNAGSGYTVYVKYSAAPTSSGNSIDDLVTCTNLVPCSFSGAGTEAFGYTTEDTSLSAIGDGVDRFGSNEWAAFSVNNSEVIYNSGAISSQTTRVGYQVGISGTTPAGAYTTTVVLTATPWY